MLKIAHFADLHASAKTKDEAFKMLKFILDYCKNEKVDYIINAGDIFDGQTVLGDKDIAGELLSILSNTPAPIIHIEGTKSHDNPGAVNIFKWLNMHDEIDHYMYTKPDTILLNPDYKTGAGIYVSVLPAPTKSFLAQGYEGSPEGLNQYLQQKLRDILAGFGAKAAESRKPHILIAHITVTGSEASTGQVMLGGDMMVSVTDLNLANADYVALGHIHKAQQPSLPRHISYAGSPYHLNFGELELKGFKIVTFDDNGKLADIEFIETPSRPRQVIDVRIEDGKLVWSEDVHSNADTRIRVYAPQHILDANDWKSEVELHGMEANSLKIEAIPQAENRIRSAEIDKAKTLREKLLELGRVKNIEFPESVLQKADQLEGVVA